MHALHPIPCAVLRNDMSAWQMTPEEFEIDCTGRVYQIGSSPFTEMAVIRNSSGLPHRNTSRCDLDPSCDSWISLWWWWWWSHPPTTENHPPQVKCLQLMETAVAKSPNGQGREDQ
jgi:hypothetical protein